MKELDVQTAMVKACIAVPTGYGFKNQNKFLAGLPDLYLSIRDVGRAFIELKCNGTIKQQIETTTLQKLHLTRLQQSGTAASVAVVIPAEKGAYDVWLTTDVNQTHIDPNKFFRLTKPKGKDWPIEDMIRVSQGVRYA
jgi:hypothetical protein